MTDVGAVEASYRENQARLWRAILLFSGDPEIADEVVAESYAQALARGDMIRDVDAWVWRSAFAIARGELKRRRQRLTDDLPELPVAMPDQTVDLVRALGTLTPKQRGAIVLHHYAGYSNRETAAILGSTTAAVGVHLNRARRKLRELLEAPDG